jgi:hypothetical protein
MGRGVVSGLGLRLTILSPMRLGEVIKWRTCAWFVEHTIASLLNRSLGEILSEESNR